MTRQVIVLNHFAVPRGQAGGTRHVELFDRLIPDWNYTLVAADRNVLSGRRVHKTSGAFRSVRTTPYRGNGASRVLNWVSYAAAAFSVGIRHRRVDVVYASSPHLLAALAGYLVARIRGAGFVLEIRDLWPRILVDMGRMRASSVLYRVLRNLELFLYAHADEIVVLAEGARGAIRDDCPGPVAITFVPNGADAVPFEAEGLREALRDRYGLDGLVFIYAGAHGPANGLDLVLDVAERVEADLPEARFLLVGDGVDKPHLTSRVQEHGPANVRFLEPLAKSDILDLLGAADIGLHVLADVPLFRYGVSPNKLFDYMAVGLPVLTNCPGEVEDLVNLAGAGLAVGPNDLEQAVRDMAAVPGAQLRTWGKAGRLFIQEHRSREILSGLLADVLNRAATR